MFHQQTARLFTGFRIFVTSCTVFTIGFFLWPRVFAQQSVVPFLSQPYNGNYSINAYFDHEYPNQQVNNRVVIYTGSSGNYSYDGHEGWDYGLPHWTSVLAAASGNAWAQWDNPNDRYSGYGYYVRIDHDGIGAGYRTIYAHLDESFQLSPGVYVREGSSIGPSGNTGHVFGQNGGYHLHFGVCPSHSSPNNCWGRVIDPNGWSGQGIDPLYNYNQLQSAWLWKVSCSNQILSSANDDTTLNVCDPATPTRVPDGSTPTATPAPTIPADAWRIDYYNDIDLNGPNDGSKCHSEWTSASSYFFKDWGEGSPGGSCNEKFAARINRHVHLASGHYNFALFADDNARIEVLHAPNGNLVVDQWWATQHYESKDLPEGDYEISIVYRDTGGRAIISAWWSGPNFPAPPRESRDPNQWYAEFWPHQDWFWDPFIAFNDGNPLPLSKNWGNSSIGYGLRSDNFSSKYTRTYHFECGNYRFNLEADDYADLDVVDPNTYQVVHRLVAEHANNPVQSGTLVHLDSKSYEIRVRHKEYGGDAKLFVNWTKLSSCSTPVPTSTYTPIPTETFTPVPATPTLTPTPLPPHILYGDGRDGALVVNAGQTVTINTQRTLIVESAVRAQPTILVTNAAGFAVGQHILVIQLRGAETGVYEFGVITAINGNSITIDHNLANTYPAGGNNRGLVVQVPQYSSVTVQGNGVLQPPAWDGTTGGVLVFKANGTVTVNGTINAAGAHGSVQLLDNGQTVAGGTGIGFAGGVGRADGSRNVKAWSGEGYHGPSAQVTYTGSNGGGGAQANGAPTHAGGGGGGHGTNGQNGIAEGSSVAGSGGHAVSEETLSQLEMGGGGGGGARESTSNVGSGGAGGGIVVILGKNVTVTGRINANGGNGGGSTSEPTSGGGGGAGGSILIRGDIVTVGNNLLTATGGTGGQGQQWNQVGGSGGNGRIRLEYGTTISGATLPAASVAQLTALVGLTPTYTPTNTPTKTWTPTNTPVPTWTNTPVPTSTFTPVPTWTNTPVPTSTFTPIPTLTFTPTPVPITPIPSNSGELITSWETGAGTWHLNVTSGAQSVVDVAQYASEGSKSVKLAFTNNPGWSHFQYNFPAMLDLSSYGKLQLHVINPGTPLTIKVSVPTGPNWAWHVSPGQSIPFGSKLVEFDLRANNWTIDSSTGPIANLNQAQGLVILIEGTQTPNALYVDNLRKLPVTTANVLYLSTSANGKVNGIKYADEDVLSFNWTTGGWSLIIDGSDIGLASMDIDAIDLQPDGTFLLSVDKDGTIAGYGVVSDEDILRFTPTSLGSATAGSFSLYFDGSDVELASAAEDIDAFTKLADGRLLISTLGNAKVTGVTAKDKDMLVFTPSSLSATTAGTWALYFDGIDVGLTTAQEDIWGVAVGTPNTIYITTLGAFAINGVNGDGADIFTCTATSTGSTTACTFSMYWDGSTYGLGGKSIDAFDIADATHLQSASFIAGIDDNQNELEGDDDEFNGDSELSDVVDEVDEVDEVRIFLPFVSR